METLTLEEMLDLFDELVRPKVIAALETVNGLAIYRNGSQVKALALSPDPATELDDGFTLVGTYTAPQTAAVSRTQLAVRHMQRTGCSRYAAAVKYGLSPSAVYRALQRMSARRCPCCGQTIKALVTQQQ
jgi:hypothetical protein